MSERSCPIIRSGGRSLIASVCLLIWTGCEAPIQVGRYAVASERSSYSPKSGRRTIELIGTDDPFSRKTPGLLLMRISFVGITGPMIDKRRRSLHAGSISELDYEWTTSTDHHEFQLVWDRESGSITCFYQTFQFSEGMELLLSYEEDKPRLEVRR